MATYQEAINRLSQKLRDSEAWPGDSTKLTEQLHLLYNAALAVMRDFPRYRLPDTESSAIAHVSAGANLVRYDLPSDVFFLRADLGVKRFIFDSIDYFPHQSVPYDSLFIRQGIGFRMHAGQIVFSFSVDEAAVFSTYVGTFKVVYAQQPTKPVSAATDFPLRDDNDFEQACSVVAAHVSGETVRDQAQSTFQAFLTQIYGDTREQAS